MSDLKWDPQDVLECLCEAPVIEEYGISYHYVVTRDGITLDLMIRPFESIVEVFLAKEGEDEPLVVFKVAVRGRVRYINDKRGNMLIFEGCVVIPDLFHTYRGWEDVFDDDNDPIHPDMQLLVQPAIRIWLA